MQPIKLLIIDDNAGFRIRLNSFLNNHKTVCVVSELETGFNIVDMIRLHQPDVVITDLSLPDMSGFSIIEKIRRESLDIGIVALTMHKDEEYRQGALDVGAHAFVTKSQLNEKLIHAIHDAYQMGKNNDIPS